MELNRFYLLFVYSVVCKLSLAIYCKALDQFSVF